MKRLTILRWACWCLSQSRPKLQNKIGLQGQSTLGCSGSGTNAHLSLPTSKVTEKKNPRSSPSIRSCFAATSIVIEGVVERRNFLTLNNTRVSARQRCLRSPSRWTDASRESYVTSTISAWSSSSDIGRDQNLPSSILPWQILSGFELDTRNLGDRMDNQINKFTAQKIQAEKMVVVDDHWYSGIEWLPLQRATSRRIQFTESYCPSISDGEPPCEPWHVK